MASGRVKAGEPVSDEVEISPEFESEAKIVIHRAGRERVQTWQHLRSMLRFDPLVDLGEPNAEYARKLLDSEDGMLRYETYLAAFTKKQEILPGLQIWDNCPGLIADMSTAIHDDKKPEDILEKRDGANHMDPLNALRHILQFLRKRENLLPRREFLAQRMNKTEHQDPNILEQIARKAERDYAKYSGAGDSSMRLSRAAMSRRVM
jgi:hypothetical protein